MEEFNWLDLSTVERRGDYTSRIQRHATVKVKGLRGTKDKALRVLKADWPYIWVTKVEDLEVSDRTGRPVAANRAAEARRGNFRPQYDHRSDGRPCSLKDVTHIAVGKARRRRRRAW